MKILEILVIDSKQISKAKTIGVRSTGHIRIHSICRTSPYPGTNTKRGYVPDSKVPWKVISHILNYYIA